MRMGPCKRVLLGFHKGFYGVLYGFFKGYMRVWFIRAYELCRIELPGFLRL